MTTTTANLHIYNAHTTTVAGPTFTTSTTANGTPIPAASAGIRDDSNMAGPSTSQTEAPSAQQIEDLNFYLKRISFGGSHDLNQIESYGGGADYEMFLSAVNSIGLQQGWSESQIIRTIEMKLKDKAREYYGALLPAERPKTMADMQKWFGRTFSRRLTVNAGKRELERCIRAPGEPLGEFAQRLKVIANKMFPGGTLTTHRLYHRNLLLVNQFLEGLDRKLANEVLRVGEFYQLDECLEVAEECEEIVTRMIPETRHDIIRRMGTNPTQDSNPNHTGEIEELGRSSGFSITSSPMGGHRENRDKQRRNYQRQPHGASNNQGGFRGFRNPQQPARREGMTRNTGGEYQSQGSPQNYPYMKNRCSRCGQAGHLQRGCTSPRVKFCYHCGRNGQPCNLNYQRPPTPNHT